MLSWSHQPVRYVFQWTVMNSRDIWSHFLTKSGNIKRQIVRLIVRLSETAFKGDHEAGPHVCVTLRCLALSLDSERPWIMSRSRNKYLINRMIHTYLWPIVFIGTTQCLNASVLGLMLQAGSFGTVRDRFIIGLSTCNNPSVPCKKPHGC